MTLDPEVPMNWLQSLLATVWELLENNYHRWESLCGNPGVQQRSFSIPLIAKTTRLGALEKVRRAVWLYLYYPLLRWYLSAKTAILSLWFLLQGKMRVWVNTQQEAYPQATTDFPSWPRAPPVIHAPHPLLLLPQPHSMTDSLSTLFFFF